MTYKSAVADTGLGGGKSVILGDPKTAKSRALFRSMGAFVDSMEGRYITAEDMNIGIPDLECVREATRWVVGTGVRSATYSSRASFSPAACGMPCPSTITS